MAVNISLGDLFLTIDANCSRRSSEGKLVLSHALVGPSIS